MVKQPRRWPKLAAICCCMPLEDGTEGVPFGVLYGKEEDTLSQLLGEVSKQLPLATTTRSWTDGFRFLEAVSDDHRPLCTSHLTALLVTLLLRWIMQEMLWSIRHSGSWRVLSQRMNSFLDKVWDSPGFQLLRKGQKMERIKKQSMDFGFPVHVCLYHVWTCKEYPWLFTRNPVNGESVNQLLQVCLSHLPTPFSPFPQGIPCF